MRPLPGAGRHGANLPWRPYHPTVYLYEEITLFEFDDDDSSGSDTASTDSSMNDTAKDAAQSAMFQHYLTDQYTDDDVTLKLDMSARADFDRKIREASKHE